MLLKSLKLKNIRSYVEQEIRFPQSSILLSGDIGSGKSTLLLAAEFALFGVSRSQVGGDALLRHGATEGSVELIFDVEGQEYRITRALKKTKLGVQQQPGTLIADGVQKELMPTELKAQVLGLLGYPEELVTKDRNTVFRYTVYCPQEAMKEILVEGADERLGILRRIFGIDKYQKIRDNAALYTKELRSQTAQLNVYLENFESLVQECESMKKEEFLLKEKLALLEPELQAKKEQVHQKKTAIHALDGQVHALQLVKQEYKVMLGSRQEKERQLRVDEERIALLRKKIEALAVADASKEALEKEVQEKEASLQLLRQEKLLVQEKIGLLQNEKEQLLQEIAEVMEKSGSYAAKKEMLAAIEKEKKEKGPLEARKEQLEVQRTELLAQLHAGEAKKRDSHELVKKIREIEKCPLCLQHVTHEHRTKIQMAEKEKLWAVEQQAKELTEKKSSIESGYRLVQEKIKLLQEKERIAERLHAEIAYFEEGQKQLQVKQKKTGVMAEELNALLERRKAADKIDLQKEESIVREKKQLLERIKEKEKFLERLQEIQGDTELLQKEIQRIATALKEKEGTLQRAGPVEGQLQEEREAFGMLLEEEKHLSVEHARLKQQETHIAGLLERLHKGVEEKKKLREKMVKLQQLHTWLDEHFAPLMVTIEKHVLTKIYQLFDGYFRDWFGMLIEDDTLQARLDDSFAPVIEQNGYEVAYAHLSGGERTSAALAYRLALNKAINAVIREIKTKDLIILDEPTEGFSTEQLDKVREVLQRLGLKQMILVSHENKVETFVEHVINVQKEEGVSMVRA